MSDGKIKPFRVTVKNTKEGQKALTIPESRLS